MKSKTWKRKSESLHHKFFSFPAEMLLLVWGWMILHRNPQYIVFHSLLSDLLRVLVWEIWIWGDYGFFWVEKFFTAVLGNKVIWQKKNKENTFSDLECVLSASVDLKYMCYEYSLYPEGVLMEFSVMSHWSISCLGSLSSKTEFINGTQ